MPARVPETRRATPGSARSPLSTVGTIGRQGVIAAAGAAESAGAIGEAVSDAAGRLAAVELQNIERRHTRQATEAQAAITSDLNDLRLEYENRTDFEVFPAEHRQRAEEMVRGRLEGIESQDVLDFVQRDAVARLEREDVAVREVALGQERVAEKASIATGVDQAVRDFGLATTPEQRSNAIFDIKRIVRMGEAQGQLDPLEAVEVLNAGLEGAGLSAVTRLLRDNPRELMARLDSKEPDEILRFLNAEQRETARTKAADAIAAADAKANVQKEVELKRKILGVTAETAEELDQEIIAAHMADMIGDRQRVAMQVDLTRQVMRNELGVANVAAIHDVLAGRGTWDANAKGAGAALDQHDAGYERMLADAPNETSVDEILGQRASDYATLGRIPPTLLGQMQSSGLSSQSFNQVARFASLFTKMQALSPKLVETIGPRESAIYQIADTRVKGGTSAEQAVADARQLVTQAPNERDEREILWKADGGAMRDRAITVLNRDLGPSFFGFGAHGEIPHAMQGAFVKNYRQNFMLMGIELDAQQRSLAEIQARWSLTTLGTGGVRMWRARPPELEYQQAGAPDEWMNREMVESVNTYFSRDIPESVKQQFTPRELTILQHDGVDPDNIRLEFDAISEMEKEPSYAISIINNEGLRVILRQPETLDSFAWNPGRFENTSEAAALRQQQFEQIESMTPTQREEVVNEARQRRQKAEDPMGTVTAGISGTLSAVTEEPDWRRAPSVIGTGLIDPHAPPTEEEMVRRITSMWSQEELDSSVNLGRISLGQKPFLSTKGKAPGLLVYPEDFVVQ